MARTSHCTARNCAGSTRSNLVRIATGSVYTLRRLDIYPRDPLLYPVVQEPARIGL